MRGSRADLSQVGSRTWSQLNVMARPNDMIGWLLAGVVSITQPHGLLDSSRQGQAYPRVVLTGFLRAVGKNILTLTHTHSWFWVTPIVYSALRGLSRQWFSIFRGCILDWGSAVMSGWASLIIIWGQVQLSRLLAISAGQRICIVGEKIEIAEWSVGHILTSPHLSVQSCWPGMSVSVETRTCG